MYKKPIPYLKPNQIIVREIVVPTVLAIVVGLFLDYYTWNDLCAWVFTIPKIGVQIAHSKWFHNIQRFHQLLYIVPVFGGWTAMSWNTQAPGLGRTFLRITGGGVWDLFPPPFSYGLKDVQDQIRAITAKDPDARVVGFYKRFTCDIDQEKKEGKNPGGPGDYWPIILNQVTRYRHMQVVGSTGSGKSASVIAPLLYQDAMSSKTATFTINPKSDTYLIKCMVSGVISKMQNGVGETVPPAALISMVRKESLAYDPLIYGTADICTKKIIGSMEFESSYYRGVQETWLMTFFRVVKTEPQLNNRIMLRHLLSFLVSPMLLQTKIKPFVTLKENIDRVDVLSQEEKKSLSAVASHIAGLVEDESLSHIFDNPTGNYLDLREVIRQGGNIFVEVDTNAKASQSRALGRMLIMELQLFASARQAGHEPLDPGLSAFIDEFASFAYNDFIGLLDKSRSAKVAFLLAHQSIDNFKRDHLSHGFKGEVVDNTRTKFLLDIKDETSKWASDLLGEQRFSQITNSLGTSSDSRFSRSSKTTSTREDWESRAMRDMFNLPVGKAFAQIQAEDGRLINCPVTLGYVDEDSLCTDEELYKYLAAEALKHPKRPHDGSLIDNSVDFFPDSCVSTSTTLADESGSRSAKSLPDKPIKSPRKNSAKRAPSDSGTDSLDSLLNTEI